MLIALRVHSCPCHISVSKRRIAGSPCLLIAGNEHLEAQSVKKPHSCHPQPFSNNCNHFSTCCVCISRAFLRKMIWSSGYFGGWWHGRSSAYESPWPFTLSHTHTYTHKRAFANTKLKHTCCVQSATVFVNVDNMSESHQAFCSLTGKLCILGVDCRMVKAVLDIQKVICIS